MATFLTGNSWYVTIDSVLVSTYLTDVALSPKNDVKDVTTGGATHMVRQSGLDDYSAKLTVGYETSAISTFVQKLKPGATYTFEFGPESNASGKPRHVQSMIVESSDMSMSADKKFVTFDLSLSGADAPSVNMYAGGVYA